MRKWRSGFINELWLLLYRKKMIAFFTFSIILPILLAVSLHALQPILGLVTVSQSFPIQMLGIYTAVWIPLFILTMTADLFPSEVAARTLKLAFLRPNTRFHVFCAKVAALAVGIGTLLVLLGVVTLICNIFAGATLSFTEGLGVLKAYVAAFVAMVALSAVFVFVSQFFKSASGFMVTAIVLYVALKISPFLLSAMSTFSPASYTDWHMLWISHNVAVGKLWSTSLYLLSSCVLFFTLGYYIFDRKEV
ncbi:ABC transporter permease subunit [Paenibacillus dokdonensis]|uniref:ABC transporter permease subunit n=1 Tax=Paenibacillus dokdonensis TaxID=2567944 RepID=UPI0010A809AB|nr:ABC transporter permease subunit [Paenibacillus dokdonensis]